jgi:putative oxidoreductase
MQTEREHQPAVHNAFLAGRILVGLYYLYSAFNHFAHLNMMSGYVRSKGLAAPTLGVVLSGLLLLVAALTLLLGWHPRIGVGALVLFFVPVTFTMHAFWNDADPMARQMDLVNFAKNVALLGSSLMFLAIPEPWPFSVGAHPRHVRQPA